MDCNKIYKTTAEMLGEKLSNIVGLAEIPTKPLHKYPQEAIL
jgi:hypothetical protein